MPLLITSTADEGKAFAPQDMRKDREFIRFWKTLLPELTPDDLTDLEKLYPNVSALPGTSAYVSEQFERLSAAFGDYAYICPVQDTADYLASASAPVYKACWNTPNWSPTFKGIPHGIDAPYLNGQSGTQFPEIADAYSAYWASFVVSGDPNTHRIKESAVWGKYQGVGSKHLVVGSPDRGGVKMEDEAGTIRMAQCAWWRDLKRAKRINK